MKNIFVLLMAQPEGGSGSGMGSMLLMFLLIFVIMYLFMVLPQRRRQKKVEEFRNSLEKGTEIVTVGGIHGKIVNVAETTFTIEIADGVKIKIEKAAVAIDESQIGKKKEEKVVSVDGNETK